MSKHKLPKINTPVEEHIEALNEGFGHQAEVAQTDDKPVIIEGFAFPSDDKAERRRKAQHAVEELRGDYAKVKAETGFRTVANEVAAKTIVEALQIAADQDGNLVDAGEGILIAAAVSARQIGLNGSEFLLACANIAATVFKDGTVSVGAPSASPVDKSKLN